jgi:hypothetical protein
LGDAAPVAKAAAALVVPVIANIHQRVYEAASRPEALEMNTWHNCENTHCRAGWIVTLAGKEGEALEARFDTVVAAMKIYDASSALEEISPVRFFDNNEDALADMKRLAELEKGTITPLGGEKK